MFGQGPSVPEISTQEAEARLKKEPTPMVLDVREPDEYEAGHIPGSKLVPLGTLDQHLDELPKDREIVVVCRSGGRSAHATQLLKHSGYKAFNMAGGMLAWQGPVER
jgi:rhodanese-related sulfurtransferase